MSLVGLVALFVVSQGAGIKPAPNRLNIGDRAPALRIGQWLRGDPAQIGQGRVVVVDFWGTWCETCRTGYPILSQLARRFAGKVDVLGIAHSEDPSVTPEKMRKFIESMGDSMSYTLAWDNEKSTTAQDWIIGFTGELTAGGAFVVDQEGKIAWAGTLGSEEPKLEVVVQQVLDRKWDYEAENRRELARRRAAEEQRIRWAKEQATTTEVDSLYKSGKFREGVELATLRGKELGTEFRFKEQIMLGRIKGNLGGYKALFMSYDLKMTDYYKKNPGRNPVIIANGYMTLLNVTLCTDGPGAKRAISEAGAFADSMLKLDPNDPEKWAAFALLKFRQGKTREARSAQTKAIELAKVSGLVDQLTISDYLTQLKKLGG